MAATLESLSQIAEIKELIVTIGRVIGGEFLVIETQGIAHLMEQASDGVGTDSDAEVGERQGNLGRRSTGPFQASDRIASGVVIEQEFDQSDDVGGFFSIGLRLPPERRARPGDTLRSRSYWRPRATVCASKPRNSARIVSPPWPSLMDSSPAKRRRCCSSSKL